MGIETDGPPVTFKSKQISVQTDASGNIQVHLSQQKFLDGVASGTILKGVKATDLLKESDWSEFRSIIGCLQWLSGQTRPGSSHRQSGGKGTTDDLRDLHDLHDMADFLKSYPKDGVTIPGVLPPHRRASSPTATRVGQTP